METRIIFFKWRKHWLGKCEQWWLSILQTNFILFASRNQCLFLSLLFLITIWMGHFKYNNFLSNYYRCPHILPLLSHTNSSGNLGICCLWQRMNLIYFQTLNGCCSDMLDNIRGSEITRKHIERIPHKPWKQSGRECTESNPKLRG